MNERRVGIEPLRVVGSDEALWQARTVWSPGEPIRIMRDRQTWRGLPDNCRALSKWLSDALESMSNALAEKRIRETDMTELTYESGAFILAVSPRASYGYLYLVAHRTETP